MLGVIGIDKFVAIGSFIKISIDLTSYFMCSFSSSNTPEREVKLMLEKYNVECLLEVANSMLRTNDNKKESTDFNIILSKNDLKELSPKEVNLYYICDNIIKLNLVLHDIKKKENTRYYIFSKNYKKELDLIKVYCIALKECISLYNRCQ